MIFLIVGAAFNLVAVLRVDEMLHILSIFSRYKWDNKPIKKRFNGYELGGRSQIT